GTALKSYGVYAAQLAGLPKPVVHRAEELLGEYEKEDYNLKNLTNNSSSSNEIERSLAEIDTDNLSPVEALMKIYELKNLLATEKQFFRKEIKAVG
ncbi:MAG: hypothetical protein H0W77_08370, partial [Acidobacteria bacterium]|nr:hypothetical protein [Acidobacteriota bacterium]